VPVETPPKPPIVRHLTLIVAIFATIVACMVGVFQVQMNILWAVHAYGIGESLWSKGQKDAVHHLGRYAKTRDPRDYEAFSTAIAVPLGDREARLELEQPHPNYDRVRRAFISARNHPDDADGLATLFRRFRNHPDMDRAIGFWAAGDRAVTKLVRYGRQLRDEIVSDTPDERRIQALATNIDKVNSRVTPLADSFAESLGRGARNVRRLAIVTTIVSAAALLVFGVAMSWFILRDARRFEQALRDSEQRYRALFEDANDSVYVHDAAGRFLAINKAAERLLGFTGGEATAHTVTDVVAPESLPLARQMLARALREGATPVYELALLTRAARRVPVEVSSRLIVQEGRPVAVQSIARDITDRRRAEAERAELLERERAARLEAELSSRAKDEFVAVLSHELRTPLTAILTWARLLRTEKLDEQMRTRALEVIERNTRLQATLIDDLLEVSRIIAGKIQLDLESVDPAAAVSAALDGTRTAAEAKGVDLVLRLDPDVGTVWGDRNRLQQAVSNLLSNAIKFTPSGGTVEIGLRREEAQACIWVRDTGIGIAPAFLPHVFERFRQADSSYTRPHGGLGLGLSIVRHLIDLHGGSVAAESDGRDQGATFYIRLPLESARRPAVARKRPAAPEPETTLLQGIDVLVVDDDADTRSALRAALEADGARVRLAESVDEAIAALDEAPPHVMLCDIAMPGQSGYDLIRRVRARGHQRGGDIPAAALTAFARGEDVERAVEAGFHRHLAKPVEPRDLAHAVAELAALNGKGAPRG
jgi:PAS domain S-box-containing protein